MTNDARGSPVAPRSRCLGPPLGDARAFAIAALLSLPLCALACDDPTAHLVSIEGVVEVRASNAAAWQTATLDQALCTGDTVALRQFSRATVVLANDVLLRLDQSSVLTLTAIAPERDSELGLLKGALHMISRFAKPFRVLTPYMNAMVDGTEFTVAVLSDTTQVSVTEGQVRAVNKAGQQLLSAGLAANAARDQAPTPLKLRPHDAVQWALYFPQIVRPTPAGLAALQPDALKAVRLAEQGRYSEALAAWPDTTSQVLPVARAGWLLGVGRVDTAEKLLSDPLGPAFASTTLAAQAMAVNALIQVVRNQASDALITAKASIAADSQAAAGQLALSYALQALRDPNAALNATRQAVTLEPDHALAWARKAELELSVGRLQDGQTSAAQALALAPQTPRARALLGFAQLLRGYEAEAQLSFAQAREAYPGDPLPHVGAGLALLRSGNQARGRREIEIAVMLDPGNAELRALLGRAYLREGRERVASNELVVARELDPHSPTPWFTDALLKQRANRPVEAAAKYQRALALNNQRAVFRPQSLLESDRAARAAALASTWRDLGFEGAMLSTARTALVDDPQSEAAHRLLAQAYAANPRFETARVSELLQAQLRQSPRSEPIAPQELQPGLPVLNGPRVLGLQESSPLFDESQGGVRLGTLAGNQGVLGSTGLVWRTVGNGQLSLGHYHYQTNGFRSNVDVRLNINNVLWQAVVNPELNVQAELRSARALRRWRLMLASSQPELPLSLDSDTFRLGLRFSPQPESEIIVSSIWSQRKLSFVDVSQLGQLRRWVERFTGRDTHLNEMMYSSRNGPTKWSAGISTYGERVTDRSEITLRSANRVIPRPTITGSSHPKHNLALVSSAWDITSKGALHVGLSHDDFTHAPVFIRRTNPKLGVTWRPIPTMNIRAVNVRGLKGSTAKEQTIGLTQFAGFNQTFDDPEGTRFRLSGFALDYQFDASTLWGLETTHRALVLAVVPINVARGCGGAVCAVRASETLHRLHLGHSVSSRWAIAAELRYESNALNVRASRNVPANTRTLQIPMRVAYFNPEGWSAYSQLQGIWQTARFKSDSALDTRTRFWLTNLGLRYKRLGGTAALVLEVANLFDREFREYRFTHTDPASIFQDSRPRVAPVQQSRTVTARVEIRF